MSKDDEIRLRYMLDAARKAISFVQGRSRGDVGDNREGARSNKDGSL